jgi:hypothetical protein
VEATGTARMDLGAELDRIEAAVAAGNDDLRALGFWRVVAQVKADPTLVETYAGRIGTIDRAAFVARVTLRAPVWVGNLILLVGAFVGATAVGLALRSATTPAWSGLLLLGAAGVWTVSFHCPVHWIVGKAVGIRFTDYFLGGPPPPRPGLKSDYATYLRADPRARAWMHASGALGTKLAPFLALAFWPASGAPWWSAAALVALGALLIATDLLFSVKSSDWKKVRREMAVARSRRATG